MKGGDLQDASPKSVDTREAGIYQINRKYGGKRYQSKLAERQAAIEPLSLHLGYSNTATQRRNE